jgi:hypothetical protein
MLKVIRFVGLAALGGVAVCFFHLGDDFKEVGQDANFHLKLDLGLIALCGVVTAICIVIVKKKE